MSEWDEEGEGLGEEGERVGVRECVIMSKIKFMGVNEGEARERVGVRVRKRVSFFERNWLWKWK